VGRRDGRQGSRQTDDESRARCAGEEGGGGQREGAGEENAAEQATQGEPMIHAYIDGAFLRERSAIAIRNVWRAEPDLDFNNIRSTLSADRLFYYDCVEDEPRPSETPEAFAVRTEQQRSLLAKIAQADLCHIRLGTLKQQERGKRVTQKEVDVRIAVDMLTHAFSRNLERAILVTSDLDFRPVIDSLVQLGTVVELRYDPAVAAVELQQAADIRRVLTVDEWWFFCNAKFRSEHPMPKKWMGQPNPVLRLLRIGQLHRRPVRLWEAPDNTYTVEIERAESDMSLCANSRDMEFLISRFLPVWQPGLVWDVPQIGVTGQPSGPLGE
jgi:uncharacterized LabA/DUF88 family protein